MSTINSNSAASNKQHWYKSPLLLGWLFLVMTAMAGTIYMVIQANSGFPGLVVDDFYERGQNYEENIHKKIADNEKWDTEFTISAVHQNKPVTINFTIKDKAGVLSPVEKITLFAYRLSDAKQDFSVPMTLAEDKTNYQATMTFVSKGKWDLLASAVIDGIEVNYAKRIFVKD
ncbi:MAG: FixH family protein [gamma proteobacterium symbiont of Lucinoma myriamae]|nr:FixH family protein [gamma proteobacterium symbiont of Lucinoma myriamae]MCU7818672.1 FixH family protein [gamma proteobacterium symbiont of Lucinoma myriamae]MCU7833074.1 FixH family protein [gamma proteobacterium symbiont of Lucinoma myriamae]